MMSVKTLESFPFLSTMPPAAREALLARTVQRSLEDGQRLFRGGGKCTHLPFVLEGTLRVFHRSEGGKEITLYRIGRGESCILTASCILGREGLPVTVEAEGRTEVLLVPAGALERLVEDNPAWRRYLFGLYAKRLSGVLSLVEEIAFRRLDERLAAHLLRSAGGRTSVVATHAGIASELGTSREVVTRILKDFQAEGLVAVARGRIRMLRPDALERRAAAPSVV
jgi:CRP/FNR family transcriptional regulator, anaerobic regulatory protein